MPSFNALVTRWLSCVESSATEYCSWSRATAATGKPFTYSCIFAVCHASGRTATYPVSMPHCAARSGVVIHFANFTAASCSPFVAFLKT